MEHYSGQGVWLWSYSSMAAVENCNILKLCVWLWVESSRWGGWQRFMAKGWLCVYCWVSQGITHWGGGTWLSVRVTCTHTHICYPANKHRLTHRLFEHTNLYIDIGVHSNICPHPTICNPSHASLFLTKRSWLVKYISLTWLHLFILSLTDFWFFSLTVVFSQPAILSSLQSVETEWCHSVMVWQQAEQVNNLI